MNLHRAAAQPDWELILPAQRNQWQQLAARTHGVVTPGNGFTILGFGLVIAGFVAVAQHSYWWGVVLVLSGRLCDLLDGWIAHKTGTKSPLGELLDSTIDKFATLIALIVLVTSHMVPLLAAALIFLINLLISAIVAIGVRRKAVLHASRSGKRGMAWAWAGLLLYIVAASTHVPHPNLVKLLADAAIVVTTLLSLDAIRGYYRDAFKRRSK